MEVITSKIEEAWESNISKLVYLNGLYLYHTCWPIWHPSHDISIIKKIVNISYKVSQIEKKHPIFLQIYTIIVDFPSNLILSPSACLSDLRLDGHNLPLLPSHHHWTQWGQVTAHAHVTAACQIPPTCSNATCDSSPSRRCINLWRDHLCAWV